MTEQLHDRCTDYGTPVGHINGRTLQESLTATGSTWPSGTVSNTEWVTICPRCHAYMLGAEMRTQPAFWAYDGVMRTFDDIDYDTGYAQTPALNFYGFRFSRNALDGAIDITGRDGPEMDAKQHAAVIGEKVKKNPQRENALEFSEAVCTWGRGGRVWGKLKTYNSSENLAKSLVEWFVSASEADSPEAAIKPGLAIKGLGVSFASKHLRILWPDCYGVLDEVISDGLGFARSVKGYRLFMHCLNRFNDESVPDRSVAEVEQGLFLLVRQSVRAQ